MYAGLQERDTQLNWARSLEMRMLTEYVHPLTAPLKLQNLICRVYRNSLNNDEVRALVKNICKLKRQWNMCHLYLTPKDTSTRTKIQNASRFPYVLCVDVGWDWMLNILCLHYHSRPQQHDEVDDKIQSSIDAASRFLPAHWPHLKDYSVPYLRGPICPTHIAFGKESNQ